MLQRGKVLGVIGTQCLFYTRCSEREMTCEMLGHSFLLVRVPSAKLGCKQSRYLLVKMLVQRTMGVLHLFPDRTMGEAAFSDNWSEIMAEVSGTDQEFELILFCKEWGTTAL